MGRISGKKNKTKTTSKKKTIVKCLECGKEKTLNAQNFFKSNREEFEDNGGYCTTCKQCLVALSIDEKDNSISERSMRFALKRLDKPFVRKVFNEVRSREGMTNAKLIGAYNSALTGYGGEYKELRYADTVDLEIKEEKILNAKVDNKKKIEVTDSMYLFWGRSDQLTNQDYIDLETKFNAYTKNDNNIDVKKEDDYKKLCVYELQRNKLQWKVDKESLVMVEKYQKMINELSDNLGIQAIQKQDEFDNNKFVIGLITRYHEDIKKDPIRRWVEDLGQIDPFRDIIQTDYIGGLGAAIGIDSPKVNEARKRMEEYMVKISDICKESGGVDG